LTADQTLVTQLLENVPFVTQLTHALKVTFATLLFAKQSNAVAKTTTLLAPLKTNVMLLLSNVFFKLDAQPQQIADPTSATLLQETAKNAQSMVTTPPEIAHQKLKETTTSTTFATPPPMVALPQLQTTASAEVLSPLS
jgi:hypothetical protein